MMENQNQKQKTGLLIQLKLDERLTERALLILVSTFLSFSGGAFYASLDNIQESNLPVENTKLVPPRS